MRAVDFRHALKERNCSFERTKGPWEIWKTPGGRLIRFSGSEAKRGIPKGTVAGANRSFREEGIDEIGHAKTRPAPSGRPTGDQPEEHERSDREDRSGPDYASAEYWVQFYDAPDEEEGEAGAEQPGEPRRSDREERSRPSTSFLSALKRRIAARRAPTPTPEPELQPEPEDTTEPEEPATEPSEPVAEEYREPGQWFSIETIPPIEKCIDYLDRSITGSKTPTLPEGFRHYLATGIDYDYDPERGAYRLIGHDMAVIDFWTVLTALTMIVDDIRREKDHESFLVRLDLWSKVLDADDESAMSEILDPVAQESLGHRVLQWRDFWPRKQTTDLTRMLFAG